MQCRAVARRCPLGSVTVLGDLAQATTPGRPGRLGDHPAAPRPRRGRRPPADRRLPRAGRGAVEWPTGCLPHIAADVPPATSVRRRRACVAVSADRATRRRGAGSASRRGVGRRDRPRCPSRRRPAQIATAPVSAPRRSPTTPTPRGDRRSGDQREGPGVRLGRAARTGRDRRRRTGPADRVAPPLCRAHPSGVPACGPARRTAARRTHG